MFIAYIVGARHCAKSGKTEECARASVGALVEACVGFAGMARKEAVPSLQKLGCSVEEELWRVSRP